MAYVFVIVLTSGLFDLLKIDFPSTLQTRQGPPQKDPSFLRAPLDTQRQFHEVGNCEAILAGNAISPHIIALERVPSLSEVAFFIGACRDTSQVEGGFHNYAHGNEESSCTFEGRESRARSGRRCRNPDSKRRDGRRI